MTKTFGAARAGYRTILMKHDFYFPNLEDNKLIQSHADKNQI